MECLVYQMNTQDVYIVSLVKGVDNGNISEDEYVKVIEMLNARPTASNGFDYRLKMICHGRRVNCRL